MKWRWWRTREEKIEAILVYLLNVGEAPGLVIAKGARISRIDIYLLLMAMTERKLVTTRPDPADEPLLPVLGTQRMLYRLDKAGYWRIDELARETRPRAVWEFLGALYPGADCAGLVAF